MSCHLHQVIEQLDSNNAHASSLIISEPRMHEWFDDIDRLSRQAICFYAGDVHGLNGLPVIPDLVKLPYPTVWIEFHSDRGGVTHRGGVLAHQDGEIDIWYLFLKVAGDVWELVSAASIVGCTAEGGITAKVLPTECVDNGSANQILSFTWAFLSALNCCNVTRVENLPPPKLQKARAKRGKKPLFSYWTLHLALDHTESSPGNGTHASPRLHLVRGHARRLHFQPGKFTWVRAYAKGDKKLGMVHKEYALDQPQPTC